jgi:hypothetical protein
MNIFQFILLFILMSKAKVLDLFLFTSVASGVALVLVTMPTAGNGFVIPAIATDLTTEDLISRQDPVQDKITICHIPSGNSTKAHDITVGESVVPDHLAHGDRIGHCEPTPQPTITVEPPTDCINTKNGSIAHARVTLTGFPIGSVIMVGASSEHQIRMEMQADTHAEPIGFSTGQKTITVFSDENRNLVKDPGEVSLTKTFTVPCYPSL